MNAYKTTILPCIRTTVFTVLTLLMIMLCAPLSAQAAINEAGAQSLKQMFDRIITEQREKLLPYSEIIADGDTLVEPSDDYYAVTLPHLSLTYPDGRTVEIGIIAINAKPADKQNQWKMSIAVPTPITIFNADGEPATIIDIGQQNAAGIWHDTYNIFVKMNARYQDITINNPDKNFTVNITDMTFLTDLDNTADNRWSGPVVFAAHGLDISASDNVSAKAGLVSMNMNIRDYDFETGNTLRNTLYIQAENNTEGENRKTTENTAENAEEAPALAGLLSTLWDGFDLKYEIADLSIKTGEMDAGDLTGETRTDKLYTLEKGHMALGIQGFRTDKISANFSLDITEGKTIPATQSWNPVFPHSFGIGFKTEKIPYKELIAEMDKMPTSQKNPQVLALQAFLTLPGVLSKAGSSIKIDNINLANDIYKAQGSATITPATTSLVGATGSGQARITGLPPLLFAIEDSMTSPERTAIQMQTLQTLLSNIEVLKAAGTETQENGEKIYSYDLEINEAGGILLNGQNIQTLMQQIRQQ